jgi:hypothetical protein
VVWSSFINSDGWALTNAHILVQQCDRDRCRRTAIVAGTPQLFSGGAAEARWRPLSHRKATHDYSKGGGFLTKISAKLYDGSSGGGGGGSGEGERAGEAGAGADGKAAPDSPPGTPATPSGWSGARRSGLTDAD